MILAVIYLLCSFYLIRKWRVFRFENISNIQLSLAFVTKLFGAFILYYVYTEIYRDRQTADIFKFYDDSLALAQVFFDSPSDFIKIIIGIHEDHFLMDYFINMNHWDNSYESVITNESRVIIKICAIINLISLNNYVVNVIIFTMLGYIGIILTIRGLALLYPSKYVTYLFWSVVLFPSIFIWSAGVLKEPLILLGVGMFLFGILSIHKKKEKKWFYWVLLGLGLVILLKVKFYIFCCILPTVVLLALGTVKQYKPLPLLSSIYLTVLIVILALHLYNFGYDPIELISIKQQDFTNLATFYRAGSYFEIPLVNSSFLDFLAAIPMGLLNGLFRPLPWDIEKTIHILPFIESILILAFISIVLFRFVSQKIHLKIKDNMYIISFTSFTLLLYTLIGITTPVIGALVRYKIPGTLFLILSIYILHIHNLKHEKK